MGSDAGGLFPFSHKPVHRVRIGQGFYLARTETTFRQFKAFVEATGYVTDAEKEGRMSGSRGKKFENASWRNPPELVPGDENPAVGVSWNDAMAFCAWLARETGQAIRLPRQAEWEYACRAAGSEADDERRLDELGWHAANCQGRAQPVARKQPNAWGLHDMLGNLAEWCADFWHHNYAGTRPPTDGTAWLPESGEERVLRGGHWGCSPKVKLLTAYSREPAKRDSASTQVGFRILWAPTKETGENEGRIVPAK